MRRDHPVIGPELDRRRFLAVGSVAALAGPALASLAGADEPSALNRFWTWDIPQGAARGDPRFVPLLRVQVHELDGETAAKQALRSLRNRGKCAGSVAVCLQGFGMAQGDPDGPSWAVKGTTALMQNWEDGVDRGLSPAWWVTPWFKSGIEQCHSWINAFCSTWVEARVADPSLPAPDRFLFDTEEWPGVGHSAKGVGQTFAAMQQDPRWDTQPIVGYGRPLSKLWEDAGSPEVHPSLVWFAPSNRSWARWYQGLCLQAADAAMDRVAYSQIKMYWPGCRCSNYRSATSFDGVDGRFDIDSRNPWLNFTHRASADLLGPVCYWVWPEYAAKLKMSLDEASLAWTCSRLDAMQASYGGYQGSSIVPWIQLPGVQRTVNGATCEQTASLTKGLLKAFDSRGIRECIVWGSRASSTTQHWDHMAAAAGMT